MTTDNDDLIARISASARQKLTQPIEREFDYYVDVEEVLAIPASAEGKVCEVGSFLEGAIGYCFTNPSKTKVYLRILKRFTGTLWGSIGYDLVVENDEIVWH